MVWVVLGSVSWVQLCGSLCSIVVWVVLCSSFGFSRAGASLLFCVVSRGVGYLGFLFGYTLLSFVLSLGVGCFGFRRFL